MVDGREEDPGEKWTGSGKIKDNLNFPDRIQSHILTVYGTRPSPSCLYRA